MDQNQGEVILIGGNHHNGLGLVRGFGRQKIRPYGIIVSENADRSFVRKSRYWKKTWAVNTEEEALHILERDLVFDQKALIIPWSDSAAAAIDRHYDMLSKHFILPSFNGKQGFILPLMNKVRQIEYMEQYGIAMLPSQIIDFETEGNGKPEIPFPLILKPVTSIEGNKSDMSICRDKNAYDRETEALRHKGFDRILAQHYLEKRKEYVVTGAVSDSRYSFTVVRHIRQWPLHFGTGSFSETVVDSRIDKFVSMTLQRIKESGYRGTIDVEFFENETGDLYINEINWRSSGRNFISKVTGIESAYMYYCDVFGIHYPYETINKKHVYSMNDATDIKHVFHKDITPGKWFSDVRRTESFSVWDSRDMKPLLYRCIYKVSGRFSSKTRINHQTGGGNADHTGV